MMCGERLPEVFRPRRYRVEAISLEILIFTEVRRELGFAVRLALAHPMAGAHHSPARTLMRRPIGCCLWASQAGRAGGTRMGGIIPCLRAYRIENARNKDGASTFSVWA